MKNVVKILMKFKLISVTLNDYKNVWGSCAIYIVLLVMLFIMSIGISCALIYFYLYLKKDNANIININANTETVIYWAYKWKVSNKLI